MRTVLLIFVAASLLCTEWICERRSATAFAESDVSQAANPSPPASRTPPQPRSSSEQVLAIEKSCSEILARNDSTNVEYTVGKNEPEAGNPGPWQTFATPADLKKVAEDASFEDQAWVWEEGGHVVHVELALPTEDWMTVAHYCFRADGTLAEINSDLDNFTYNLIARREWVFDTKGRVLGFTEHFLDLETAKPKKPDPEFVDVDVETPRYLRVTDLPFASLLQKTATRP